MKKVIYFLSGVALFGFASCMNNKPAKNYNQLVDEATSSFIKQGLEAGQTEIKASKIAETNSKNPRVISFAKMMIADHSQAGDELEKIAINNRVRGEDSISTVHQQNISDLTNLSGNKFDKAYMQMMVADHRDAVKLFTEATKNQNEDILKFAKKTLPVLQTHLDSANAVSASLK
ncbi:DUF4142 domain-containing protein [Mucilaginibacter corticis]|uniref:DUF4142 domain-containing protein n=1 Tax=Mucilaginibacter corticis TaxID=2597670 RepID=A0A556MLA5_9SPHI|nr:DUF4142 domain-containing protein [Mucilaginibacter corticis]TSJ40716.1 DUF4142 domain-containing protein [Mucilaginibacter corticis]